MRFCFKRKFYLQKVQFPQVFDIPARMRDGGGRSEGPESRWRRA